MALIADFSATPLIVEEGYPVQFIDQTIVQDDIFPGTIVSRIWDFGDGNTSTEQNPVHKYNQSGVFTVSLVVGALDDTPIPGTIVYDTETKVDYIEVTLTEIFTYLPNWLFPVTASFNFNTVITTSRRKSEQRRGLRDKPLRMQDFTITDNEEYESIWNYLVEKHSSSFFNMVYSEPLRPTGTGPLFGKTFIKVNDFSFYYSLKNLTEFIVIIDLRGEVAPEFLAIDSLTDDNTINLNSSVALNSFKQYSVIYPLYSCHIAGKNRSEVTDTMTKFDLSFEEIIE